MSGDCAPDHLPASSGEEPGQEPETWGHQDSQEVRVSINRLRVEGFSARLRRQQWQHPSPGSSGFHHADERQRLRAGGLRYPDTAQVLCLGPGLCTEVSVTDLLLY